MKFTMAFSDRVAIVVLLIAASIANAFAFQSVSKLSLMQPSQRVTSPARSRVAMEIAKGGNVLVTGVYKDTTANDKHIFNVLNAQKIWKKIGFLAPEESTSVAKKKLLSRESRYSGLLDQLVFENGDPTNPVTLKAYLSEYNALLAYDVAPGDIEKIVDVAIEAGTKNLVLTSAFPAADAAVVAAAEGAQQRATAAGLTLTLLRTAPIADLAEGDPYELRGLTERNVGEDESQLMVSKGDLMRVASESFLVKSAGDRLLAVVGGDADSDALWYLRHLRSKGMDRREELEHIASGATPKLSEWARFRAEKEAAQTKLTQGVNQFGKFTWTEEDAKLSAQKTMAQDLEMFSEGWRAIKEDFDEEVESRLKTVCEFYWWRLYDQKAVQMNRAAFRQRYAEFFRPLAVALQRRFAASYRLGCLWMCFGATSRAEFEEKTGKVMEWDDEEYDALSRRLEGEDREDEIAVFTMQGSETMWASLVNMDLITPEMLEAFDADPSKVAPVEMRHPAKDGTPLFKSEADMY